MQHVEGVKCSAVLHLAWDINAANNKNAGTRATGESFTCVYNTPSLTYCNIEISNFPSYGRSYSMGYRELGGNQSICKLNS